MNNEALLIIDVQEAYFTVGPYLLNHPVETAERIKILLNYFRDEKKPVIFIKHRFKANSEISNIVQPQTGEAVIEKSYPSSFLGTDLKEFLDAHEIKKLVVVGMMSHMCVDTTVRACQNYGLEVIVIDDCCTTKALLYNGETMDADTVHNVFMASLNGMFAKVMSLADFMRI